MKVMRFSGFRESVFDPRHNPPARVARQESHPMIAKWKRTVDYVVRGIQKLMDFGGVNEARYSDVVHKVEPFIFPAECAYVCNFLQKNGVELRDGKKWEKMKCGTEGCGYFFGDKVLKCTFGKHEWEIAGHLKGDRDLFPVIDTDMEPKTKTYLILSWKLQPGDDLDYRRGGTTQDCWCVGVEFLERPHGHALVFPGGLGASSGVVGFREVCFY